MIKNIWKMCFMIEVVKNASKTMEGKIYTSKFMGVSFITLEMATYMNKVMTKDMNCFCVEGLPVLKGRS
jgi:hypothetical protein